MNTLTDFFRSFRTQIIDFWWFHPFQPEEIEVKACAHM